MLDGELGGWMVSGLLKGENYGQGCAGWKASRDMVSNWEADATLQFFLSHIALCLRVSCSEIRPALGSNGVGCQQGV